MSWGKIDDRMPEHPKWAALERSAGARVWADALATWVVVLCYANRNETDGEIERTLLERISPIGKAAIKAADAMVEARLMERTEHGYRLYAFTEYNPSKAAKEAVREADKRRKADGKPPGRPKVFQPDSERKATGVQPEEERLPKYPDPTRPDPIPRSPSESVGARAPDPNPARTFQADLSTIQRFALIAYREAGAIAPMNMRGETPKALADLVEPVRELARRERVSIEQMAERLLAGFLASPRAKKSGYPIAYLVQNPNEYLTRSAAVSDFSHVDQTINPADLLADD